MTSSVDTLERELECSICHDIFQIPVTIPCGHNFCKACITRHWQVNFPFTCPLCMETFSGKPALRLNPLVSGVASHIRGSTRVTQVQLPVQKIEKPVDKFGDFSKAFQPFKPSPLSPDDVPCELCKMRAVKSCTVCLESYCESHLESHHSTTGLKKHQLIDPVKNLESRVCKRHDRNLEFYCQTDQTSICINCTVLDHAAHIYCSMSEEYSRKRATLKTMEAELQQKIKLRRLKIEQLEEAERINKDAAERKMAAGLQVFTSLTQCLEKGVAELMRSIEEKKRITTSMADNYISKLEEETSQLKNRAAEMEQLSRSNDHFHVLQTFPTATRTVTVTDWSNVGVTQPLYEEMVRKCVITAVEHLEVAFKRQKKKLLEAELSRVQQFEADVVLNPDTANAWLILSHDGKQVYLGDMKRSLPNSAQRFHPSEGAMAKQGFSSGKFYFEVYVKDVNKWDIGVVNESINKKVRVTQNHDRGHWLLSLRKGKEYIARARPDVFLNVPWHPQKVGVFVDYDERRVSFYDVDGGEILYSFTDCYFTDKLYPYLSPGQATPLIISHVMQPR